MPGGYFSETNVGEAWMYGISPKRVDAAGSG
jgi:hypothetical protein